MTNTESIFHTMRILRAPPIPTQKIAAPTLEQLNASNPERRAIALGAMVVGPAGLLFALICFAMMPPAPPSAAEVARANHILTVADGPGQATPAVNVEENRRKNPWLPDPDDTASAAEAARYLPAGSASGSARRGGGAAGAAGAVEEGGDPYNGIDIWPGGAGTHARPEGREKPIALFEKEKKEEPKRKDTKTVPAKGVEVAKVPEAKPERADRGEPKVMKGKEGGGSVRTKELKLGEPAPAPKKASPASPASAPAPAKAPAKLEDDDLKKPTLD
ncbi:MAG: hypothetical protein QM723_20840 [Myxococcaceae bacterium]